MKPSLHEGATFDFYSCPEVPTYSAGHLVSGNGDWRSKRPVVMADKCTGCLQCYLYCPDGALEKLTVPGERPTVRVNYDFCKGCGICVKMCKFAAMSMEDEPHD